MYTYLNSTSNISANIGKCGFLNVKALYFRHNYKNKVVGDQLWGSCNNLQDVVALAIEHKKPKLWILDKGNAKCLPKLSLYSIFQSSISRNIELRNVDGGRCNSIVVEDYGIGKLKQSRIFVGNAGDNTILLVLVNDEKIFRITMSSSEFTEPMYADFLALSKLEDILYFTSQSNTALFSMDLYELDILLDTTQQNDSLIIINATYLGEKLELSIGLETDYKDGIIYYLVRDYAIVRWITSKPLVAEYHNVLAQSYERLPYVSQIFTGPQNGIWALVNPFNPDDCSIMEDNNAGSFERNRVEKILKYNKFIDVS